MGLLVCCNDWSHMFCQLLDYSRSFQRWCIEDYSGQPARPNSVWRRHYESCGRPVCRNLAQVNVYANFPRTNATWGLRRISNCQPLPKGSSPSWVLLDYLVDQSWTRCSSLSYNYTYPESAGSGVDIYIVGKTVYLFNPSLDLRQLMLRYWCAHHPCMFLHHHPRAVMPLKRVF